MSWFWGAILAFSVAVFSYRHQFFTLDGAIGAFFIGWIIFGFGKLAFSVVIIVFFFSSSFLSKLGNAQKTELVAYSQKVNQRNVWQILANGSVPTALLGVWFFCQESIFILLFLISVAAATADTWATEIGVLSKSEPRSILNFNKVPTGTSGGISLLGTAAALAGALTVAIWGLYVFSVFLKFSFTLKKVWLVTIVALAAQVFDSVLGATLQAKYKCEGCGKISEKNSHCPGSGTEIISGRRWMSNNAVNWFSAIFAVTLGWVGSVLLIGNV